MSGAGEAAPAVLFLCTGNSARSILAEGILARAGGGRIRAYSAGSHPKGAVNPLALELLAVRGHDTGFARSKSWDEFAGPGAPEVDAVITVCDHAAGEVCPIWPGRPARLHWGLPDPAAVREPAAARQAFAEAYDALAARIGDMLREVGPEGDPAALRTRLAAIAP